MARFKLKESKKEPTSYAGLSLIGQCLETVNIEAVVEGQILILQGINTSDLLKTIIATRARPGELYNKTRL